MENKTKLAQQLLKKRKQEASARFVKIEENPGVDYFVSKAAYQELDEEQQNTLIKKFELEGIRFGFGFALIDRPNICFSTKCDSKLEKANFLGTIEFGNLVTLNSSIVYPMHNGPVSLTIIKTADDRIGRIKIGDNVNMPGTTIISYKEVIIGNNVLLGPLVTILDSDGHALLDRGGKDEHKRISMKAVNIQDNVWIGQNVIILKGVTIGEGAIIGAGSVVTKSIPPYTVAAGNPAKIIKKLKDAAEGSN